MLVEVRISSARTQSWWKNVLLNERQTNKNKIKSESFAGLLQQGFHKRDRPCEALYISLSDAMLGSWHSACLQFHEEDNFRQELLRDKAASQQSAKAKKSHQAVKWPCGQKSTRQTKGVPCGQMANFSVFGVPSGGRPKDLRSHLGHRIQACNYCLEICTQLHSRARKCGHP